VALVNYCGSGLLRKCGRTVQGAQPRAVGHAGGPEGTPGAAVGDGCWRWAGRGGMGIGNRPVSFVVFHLHRRGEWCEFFCHPLCPQNVAGVLWDYVQPEKLILCEPDWSVYAPKARRPLYRFLRMHGVPYQRVSRRAVVTDGSALRVLQIRAGDDFGADYAWSEAPVSAQHQGRIARLIGALEREGAWQRLQLEPLEKMGVRFVYLGHDGGFDSALLYLKFPDAGAAFGSEAVREFLVAQGGGTCRGGSARRRRGMVTRPSFYPPQRDFSRKLATYSADVGVFFAARDVETRVGQVVLKCWRGHLRFFAPADGSHPLVSEVNESFDIRYDCSDHVWSVSPIRKEACPYPPDLL
jgi:hypothetical protein